MNQTNYYQQQTPQPPRKNRTALWIVIGVLIAGLFGTIAFYAVSFGKKMGEGFGKMADVVKTMQDSLANNTNAGTYADISELLGTDSVSEMFRKKLDSLQQATNSICDEFKQAEAAFEDTLHSVHASGFDKNITISFFINTGRAKRLKNELLNYREAAIANMPPAIRDTSMKHLLMVDEMSQHSPGVFKKLLAWENNYAQAPSQAISSMKTTLIMIRGFESSLLAAYKREIKLKVPVQQANDSVQ